MHAVCSLLNGNISTATKKLTDCDSLLNRHNLVAEKDNHNSYEELLVYNYGLKSIVSAYAGDFCEAITLGEIFLDSSDTSYQRLMAINNLGVIKCLTLAPLRAYLPRATRRGNALGSPLPRLVERQTC